MTYKQWRPGGYAREVRQAEMWLSLLSWWRARSVLVRDGALAMMLALLAFVPLLAKNGMELGELPRHPLDAVGVLAALAQCLPLVVRRRWPALCLAVAAAGFALQQLGGYSVFTSVAVLAVMYSVGAYQDRARRLLAVAATAAYVMLAVALRRAGSPERPLEFGTFYLVLAGFWAAGGWMRSVRAGEAERRRLHAEAVRAAERASIARELHDVVTHHVTAMVVQADAAQYLTGVPERMAESLSAISATGRNALTELRHLLDVLNPDGHPQAGIDRSPAIGEVQDLVRQIQAAGQPVELTEAGPRQAGGGPGLAAYRVVQEALTNALKYAPRQRTVVSVHYGADSITVEVTNDGPSAGTRPRAGGGRGLAGLRERVEVFGGELSAHSRADGGFTVRARIPTGKQP